MLVTRLLALTVLSSVALHAQSAIPADAHERSCAPGSSPLLILGTYHMANPGQDAVNMEADDPRSPRRQRELAVLLDQLSRFKPTSVAIEGTFGRTPWLTRYRDYLAGSYALGTNEIEQIAFPLAKRAGIQRLAAVDYPMWMDGRIPDEIDYDWRPPAPTAPPAAAPSAPAAPAEPSEKEQLLRRSTITEFLRHLNSEDYMRADHALYMPLLRPDTTSNAPFAHGNQLLNWYKRNIRIFTNLYRTSRVGEDRIVLLIGAGHLSILRQFAIDSPDFCLMDTQALLR